MIFDRLLKNAAARDAPRQGAYTLTLDNAAGWGVNEMVSATSAMKLSAVNACVECITNSISKLPIFIMEENTRNRIEHPLLKLLNERPNEAMTPSVYSRLVEGNRLLTGNGYALIYRSRQTAEPVELLPVQDASVTPYLDDNGKLWYVYTNPKTGEMRKLLPFDVLHYKAYSYDGIRGVSVLSRAAEVIRNAQAAQQYEGRFYRQNAQPSGIIKANTLLETPAKNKIRESWEEIHSGIDGAFRVAVLDQGLDYKQISLSNQDAQFVESRSLSVEDIARFFCVPLYKINSGKQSYSSNEQNGIEYVTGTLQPIVTQYEQEDTYKLLFDRERNRRLRIRRNMMAELRGDVNSRGSWYKTMREVGVFSPNDILALEDMPPVRGGESRYASLNYVPLERFDELSQKRAEGGEQN